MMKYIPIAIAAALALGIGTASAENCGKAGAELGIDQCDGGNLRVEAEAPDADKAEGGNKGGDSGRQD